MKWSKKQHGNRGRERRGEREGRRKGRHRLVHVDKTSERRSVSVVSVWHAVETYCSRNAVLRSISVAPACAAHRISFRSWCGRVEVLLAFPFLGAAAVPADDERVAASAATSFFIAACFAAASAAASACFAAGVPGSMESFAPGCGAFEFGRAALAATSLCLKFAKSFSAWIFTLTPRLAARLAIAAADRPRFWAGDLPLVLGAGGMPMVL